MKKNIILSFLLSLFSLTIFSQTKSLIGEVSANVTSVSASANSTKTANSQDFLTNFYRVSLDSILGKNHTYSFNSTFYSLETIMRTIFSRKIKLELPKTYQDLKKLLQADKFLKNNSLNFSLKGDSSNNLSSFSTGFTISIFNRRDILHNAIKYSSSLIELEKYFELYRITITKINEDLKKQNKGNTQFLNDLNQADSTKKYSQLPDATKDILLKYSTDSHFSKEERALLKNLLGNVDNGNIIFNNLNALYSRKPLLTFTPSYSYNITNKQPTYSFGLDFLFSLNPKDSHHTSWDGEIKTNYQILNDTSIKSTNFQNKPFSISVGINKVLLQDDKNQSLMEAKFFLQDVYQFEKPTINKFTLNSSFRINIYKSLWLPITISYDPKKGNVLGFLSITANLGS